MILLAWCNGVLFHTDDFEAEDIVKKQIEGILYLKSFVYVKSQKIQISKWNGYSIEVVDLTGYSFFEDLTKSILGME